MPPTPTINELIAAVSDIDVERLLTDRFEKNVEEVSIKYLTSVRIIDDIGFLSDGDTAEFEKLESLVAEMYIILQHKRQLHQKDAKE